MTDHTDDPLPYLIAANERLHAEVHRLTDEHGRMVEHLSGMDERTKWLNRRVYEIAAENLTLRADLATSEQTIAALKAQLQRVKEIAG